MLVAARTRAAGRVPALLFPALAIGAALALGFGVAIPAALRLRARRRGRVEPALDRPR